MVALCGSGTNAATAPILVVPLDLPIPVVLVVTVVLVVLGVSNSTFDSASF